MRWRRREQSQQPPTSLHSNTRPLTSGASVPVADGGLSTFGIVTLIAGVSALMILLASPIVVFFAAYGDPYGRGFVERRPGGLYAQLRACEGDTVHSVEVYAFQDRAASPAQAFWAARDSRGGGGAPVVKLFDQNPGFAVSSFGTAIATMSLNVVINRGRQSEASVEVDPGTLGVGDVEFGGDPDVSTEKYLSMSDSDFGCAP